MTGSKCATELWYTDEETEHNTLDITSADNTIIYITETVVPRTVNNYTV